eukprot:451528_1
MSAIEKTDAGLSVYYEQMGRNDYFNSDKNGKFAVWCEENGYDDEEIIDEMEVKDATEFLFIEIDMDDNGNNMFPLPDDIRNENEKATKIMEIIQACYQNIDISRTKTYNININANATLDFDQLLAEFERCVFDTKCQIIPNPFYSPSIQRFIKYNYINAKRKAIPDSDLIPSKHIEKAKKIIKEMENIVRSAVNNENRQIHPFYIYFLHTRSFYSATVNGAVPVDLFCGNKIAYQNKVLQIFKKGDEMTKNEAKYAELLLAGRVYTNNVWGMVGQFDNYKQWKEWYYERINIYIQNMVMMRIIQVKMTMMMRMTMRTMDIFIKIEMKGNGIG